MGLFLETCRRLSREPYLFSRFCEPQAMYLCTQADIACKSAIDTLTPFQPGWLDIKSLNGLADLVPSESQARSACVQIYKTHSQRIANCKYHH
jgi:hypothetical protein